MEILNAIGGVNYLASFSCNMLQTPPQTRL
jgi:hypothetical protein